MMNMVILIIPWLKTKMKSMMVILIFLVIMIDKPESKSQVPKSNGKGKGEFGLLAVSKISWPINYDKYDYYDHPLAYSQDED